MAHPPSSFNKTACIRTAHRILFYTNIAQCLVYRYDRCMSINNLLIHFAVMINFCCRHAQDTTLSVTLWFPVPSVWPYHCFDILLWATLFVNTVTMLHAKTMHQTSILGKVKKFISKDSTLSNRPHPASYQNSYFFSPSGGKEVWEWSWPLTTTSCWG
jgi:hypothetical protein